MKVWVERIGSFSFHKFLFAPGKVEGALYEFCASRRRYVLAEAELGIDRGQTCNTLEFASGKTERVLPMIPALPCIFYSPQDGRDVFHLDHGVEIFLAYIPIHA